MRMARARPRAACWRKGLVLAAWLVAATALAPGILAQQAAPGDACNTLLVVEKGDATLSAYDIGTRRLLWRTPVGAEAHEVAVLRGRALAYVSHYGGPGSDMHDLAVVDLRSGNKLGLADIAPLRSPHGLLARDGKVWFTAETSKAIGRWDPDTARVEWLLGLGTERSHMLIALPGGAIATANSDSGSVSVISPVSTTFAGGPARPNWKVEHISTGAGTQGIDVTPDGRFIWASAAREGVVRVIDLPSRTVVETIPLPWKAGNRLRITGDGKMALVAGEELLAIETATKSSRRLRLGTGRAEGLLVAPGDRAVFVALPQENRVAVVRLPDLTLDGMIETGATPDGLACYQRE
jgi:DNA-binding beta-propeller fold protein YncE